MLMLPLESRPWDGGSAISIAQIAAGKRLLYSGFSNFGVLNALSFQALFYDAVL